MLEKQVDLPLASLAMCPAKTYMMEPTRVALEIRLGRVIFRPFTEQLVVRIIESMRSFQPQQRKCEISNTYEAMCCATGASDFWTHTLSLTKYSWVVGE